MSRMEYSGMVYPIYSLQWIPEEQNISRVLYFFTQPSKGMESLTDPVLRTLVKGTLLRHPKTRGWNTVQALKLRSKELTTLKVCRVITFVVFLGHYFNT